MSNTELITCQEVLRLTGIRSRSTIWRKMRKGAFPTQSTSAEGAFAGAPPTYRNGSTPFRCAATDPLNWRAVARRKHPHNVHLFHVEGRLAHARLDPCPRP